MKIEEIIDQLDELIERAWNLPLTGGRCAVDADKVRELIDELRYNIPADIREARAVVADRGLILSEAKREAETIVRKAEERARQLTAQTEIMKHAQAKGSEILRQAKAQSKEICTSAQEFSDEALKQVEDVIKTNCEALAQSLAEVRSTRQALNKTKISRGRNE